MEVCDNMIDDDCDGQIDCMDSDCPPCPPIRREPSGIQFGPPGAGLDRFKSHGRVQLSAPVDDVTRARVAWLITNASGVIYQASLRPGDLTPRKDGPYYFFKDDGAHLGQGTRDGLGRVLILVGGDGFVRYKVKGYGDMSAATDPEMALQFYFGDEVFVFPATWRRVPSGWIAPPPPLVPANQRH